jgi:hypothetical protein
MGMESREASAHLFEQLWLLRHCYALRGDYDRRPTMSVDDAISYAEELTRRVLIREAWRGGSAHQAA